MRTPSRRKRAPKQPAVSPHAGLPSPEYVAHILQAIPHEIYWKDLDGAYLGCNEAFARAAGLKDPREVIGKTDFDLAWTAEQAEAFRAHDRQVASAKAPQSGILEAYRHSDGSVRWAETTKVPLMNQDGEVWGVLGISQDVTEREEAKVQSREGEARFRAAFQASPDLMAVTRLSDGRILDVNDAFTRMLGYTRKEAIGKTTGELAIWADPAHREVFASRLAQTGRLADHEIYLRRKDGTLLPCLDSARTFRFGGEVCVFSVAHDISGRRRAEGALRDSEAFLTSLLDAIPVPVFYKDAQGRYLGFNQAFEDFFGETKEAMAGKTVFDLNPSELAAVYQAKDQELFEAGGKQTYESEVKNARGETRQVVFHKALFAGEDGAAGGLIGAIQDVTDLKRAEEARREGERGVRRKLEALLSPEADLGVLELSDILDSPRIQALMDHFYALTHIGIGIIDLRGKVLVGTGWQDICTKFHRVNKESCRLCIESDLELSQGVPPGTFKLYKCKNHMWDMATPIMLGDHHVGNIFLGQFLFEGEEPDRATFREQARRYGFDEQEYLAALDRVPRWTHETVEATMAFYGALAGILGDLSFGNIKLARALEARRRDRELRETLYRIARAADTSGSLADMLSKVHRAVQRIMPARNFYVALQEESDGLIHFSYFADEKDPPPGPVPPGSSLTAFVLKTRRPLLATAERLSEMERQGAVAPQGSSAAVWLGVPLLVEGRAIGVLAVQHYADPKAFGEGDLKILEFVASEMARAVEHKRAEVEVLRLKRLYEVLSRTNEMIIRAKTPQEIYEGACRIAVELGLYSMAWVGAPDEASGQLRPLAASGDSKAYLDRIRISVRDAQGSPGPVGTAFREGRRVICRDVEHDPVMAPFRDAALSSGFRSLVALPLFSEGGVSAVFAVYASEEGRFSEAEVRLLEELAADMSYALEAMRREDLQKRAEADLRLLATAIEQATEVVVVTDTKGTILYANPALEKISGYTRWETVGKNPRILKSGLHDRAFYKELWDTILAGGTWSGQIVNRRKDGTLYTEEGIISPVRNPDGQLIAFVAVKRDVTREIAMTEQLARARNLETVGMIAGGVAHEVRNPLFAISTIVTALERKLADQTEFGEYVTHIKDQTRRLNDLMNDLLNLGRPANPKDFVPLDLRRLLLECKELLSAAGADPTPCALDLGPEPVEVLGIPARLQQVFMNLGQNAISYSPPGGTVIVRVWRDMESAWVSIADEGPGIPEGFLPRLFQPFQTTRKGGTGLGLAIVRQIVSAHGGAVTASNNAPPPGATFTVRLPVISKGPGERSEDEAKR